MAFWHPKRTNAFYELLQGSFDVVYDWLSHLDERTRGHSSPKWDEMKVRIVSRVARDKIDDIDECIDTSTTRLPLSP